MELWRTNNKSLGYATCCIKKWRFSMRFWCIEPWSPCRKQEVLGVFLLLHSKTVLQVIYYDQHSRRLCSSLETECKLVVCYPYYKSWNTCTCLTAFGSHCPTALPAKISAFKINTCQNTYYCKWNIRCHVVVTQ